MTCQDHNHQLAFAFDVWKLSYEDRDFGWDNWSLDDECGPNLISRPFLAPLLKILAPFDWYKRPNLDKKAPAERIISSCYILLILILKAYCESSSPALILFLMHNVERFEADSRAPNRKLGNLRKRSDPLCASAVTNYVKGARRWGSPCQRF